MSEDQEKRRINKFTPFNTLTPNQKWEQWKTQKGKWVCDQCGTVLEDGPNHAQPFHGCSICCGTCDRELTCRTGGGQSDPFRWILVTEDESEVVK